MTLFYVFVGCTVQFLIGLGLAVLCAQPIRGRAFFRVVFFLPLMITPIGIGYAFRMLADTTKGPFAPVWQWVGLGDFAWVTSPWAARIFIVVGDSWQWIPFIFVVLLAALESVPRDLVEAGHVDGAGGWQIFREITWPQIAPVAATVMLIRVIEAFKLVDLPNIMTAGGPGIATESMTLHAFFAWRAPDLAQSAAISYLLLFVTVVLCVSFFNLVVLQAAGGAGMSTHAGQRAAPAHGPGTPVRAGADRRDVARRQGDRLQPPAAVVGVRPVPALLGRGHLAQAADRRQRRAGLPALGRLHAEPARLARPPVTGLGETAQALPQLDHRGASSRPRSAC